jgi:hypothetical protein
LAATQPVAEEATMSIETERSTVRERDEKDERGEILVIMANVLVS